MCRAFLSLTLLLICAGTTVAAEPVLSFLEGLRSRRYYDMAMFYLQEVEQDPNLPKEILEVLPYERGQTLLESAKGLASLDTQRQQLDAAQAAFESFVKANPNHPLAGNANTARGHIFLEKARVDVFDAEKPSNDGIKETLRENARKSIAIASGIFEEARVQHEKNWKVFPVFIPEDQVQQRQARAEAEKFFMLAQLDLAKCTFWEAQTYDRSSPQRKEVLVKAADQFEAIHQKYRSQMAGLQARVWQGKCFEEQGGVEGIRIALGIYGETLEHEGTTVPMRNLKNLALRFRLICLNSPERHDYNVVISEAEAWLKDARDLARTDVGLGIQWELSRAQEALGMDRNLTESVRKGYLTQALTRARTINKYPGEFKTPSSAMIQRLLLATNRDGSDPKDFDTAYGNAGVLYEQVTAANAQIRKLQGEGKEQEAIAEHAGMMANAAEMTRLYDLGLRMVKDSNDPILVNTARLRLAYGYYLQQRFFEAAVVANDQMIRYGEKFPDFAREAGFLSMTAFDSAYTNAPEGNRQFEADQVIAAANSICDRWPDSDRANDARNTIAKIFWNNGDFITAAGWWEKIPFGSSQYGESQVRAGKAYWRMYVLETAKPESEGVANPEDLKLWKQNALERLVVGIEDAEKSTPADRPLSDDIVGAKLTLVGIRNLDGIYQSTEDGTRGALELLTKDPHPVLAAVDVPEGEARPQDPTKAKSRQMASLAYQQLLRAWVGLKNLDEARNARIALEKVAAGEDGTALTQVFVDFGRELEQELSRLKAAGDIQRLDDVRAGFESFMNDLFNRKDGQTFYSLLWIAETYSSLADSSSDKQEKKVEFYNRAAAAYESMLQLAAADPKFATPQQVVACKLRLVNCLREQKKFAAAETIVVDVLQGNQNAPDAQFQAAELYEDWGASDPAEQEKFKIALYGRKQPVHVWGWTYAAQSLQQAVYSQSSERLESLLTDARYRLADGERKFGLALSEPKESREHLVRARSAITGFQRISKRWSDEDYMRFNALYKQILGDLADPVVDLPRQLLDTDEKTAELMKADAIAASKNATAPVVTAPKPAETPPPAPDNTLLIILIVSLAAAAVAGLYFMGLAQANKKKTGTKGADVETVKLGNGPVSPLGPVTAGDAPPPFTLRAAVPATPAKGKGTAPKPAFAPFIDLSEPAGQKSPASAEVDSKKVAVKPPKSTVVQAAPVVREKPVSAAPNRPTSVVAETAEPVKPAVPKPAAVKPVPSATKPVAPVPANPVNVTPKPVAAKPIAPPAADGKPVAAPQAANRPAAPKPVVAAPQPQGSAPPIAQPVKPVSASPAAGAQPSVAKPAPRPTSAQPAVSPTQKVAPAASPDRAAPNSPPVAKPVPQAKAVPKGTGEGEFSLPPVAPRPAAPKPVTGGPVFPDFSGSGDAPPKKAAPPAEGQKPAPAAKPKNSLDF
ncbi:hypothetical protein SH668x_001054 [Planctomicrobium sp. SH668]|uniref:hypothetical protein n=1 Tax=Planctomicrobium sp. SH668 TaxID=3448126 RepID=UPI003F5BA9FF